ncbi:hypothetical protein L198_02885 [Cryptococcus wingfieldii CBS 7118]|uniref:TatD DNase n=1 Tax=Cryptococcus wingfieldii CBS 7118 TaxID=1295528 RepID=A0A1E3JIU7_9TREE|nr:hypothetical protein L198_02885 [Cryptococcus wingfieldii CBS 7118]ODO00566.1 hypothetical protein L198_02885 [Cryptococcus wingfieldii CBS 7118]
MVQTERLTENNSASAQRQKAKKNDQTGPAPPDWEAIDLPPDYILAHLTDVHCHPTDLTHPPEVYDAVKLGGLAGMATVREDQDKVRNLSLEREWMRGGDGRKGKEGRGVGVVACFVGYHPWFTHRYTFSPPESLPSKEEHYTSLFFPASSSASASLSEKPTQDQHLLSTLLPYMPEPLPFQPMLAKLREDLEKSLGEERLTMVGEVGLDGSARMRWPQEGKGEEEEEEEWRRLTPFKVPLPHQRAILLAQIDIAIELGVNVSLHSVACSGPTMDALMEVKKNYGERFLRRKHFPNLFISPSIPITSRSPHAPALIRAIPRNRMLVESDCHDVRLVTRMVWGVVRWVGEVRGWGVEGVSGEGEGEGEEGGIEGGDWEMQEEEDEVYDEKGRLVEGPVWTVRQVERNWARFMRLIQD